MTDPKPPLTDIDPSLFEEAVESVERHKHRSEPPAPEGDAEEILVEETAEDEEPREAKEPKEPSDKDEFYDRFVRLTADFDNFRKRVQKEKTEYIRFGHEDLVKELLPVLDNFDRALLHAKDETSEKGSFAEGVKMIYTQILGVLEQFGVRGKASLGQDFDPLIHEAMNQQSSDEYEAQKVMEEHRKAYFLHDRLIRPALVTVSTGPDNSGESENEELSEDDKETKEVV